jgi:hydrogenase maturation protease
MNIRIVGLGNVFMSDKGFGPYVVRVLEAFYEMSPAVQIVDGGMPGVELAPHLEGADAVIVIDTLQTGQDPGEIQVSRWPEESADAASRGPLLIGVVPEWVATGVTLSRPVRSAIAPVVGLIVSELERLGHGPQLRAIPRHPDTWWERADVDSPVAV